MNDYDSLLIKARSRYRHFNRRKRRRFIFMVFLGDLFVMLCAMLFITQVMLNPEKDACNNVVKTDSIVQIKYLAQEVAATYYNPIPYQCDNSPLITADGSRINLKLLKKRQIRWVALSQDMLKRKGGLYSFGDTVYVYHRNPLIKGMWIVHDCMNARYKNRIDFLVDIEDNEFTSLSTLLISPVPFYNERN